MPRLVYFSSASGNTARFIARLGCFVPGMSLERIPISPSEPMPGPGGDYILICPTFADGEGRGAVPKQVIRFLNDPDQRAGIRGVIAGGNRNFGATYALSGKVITQKCNVPLLYSFELAGTDDDIARMRNGLVRFWWFSEIPECALS